jgi:transcriptional regulator with GAF, ATPase, and Fis domain
MVREGKFREDFFYRINVIPIHTPPPCETEMGISLCLPNHFFGNCS